PQPQSRALQRLQRSGNRSPFGRPRARRIPAETLHRNRTGAKSESHARRLSYNAGMTAGRVTPSGTARYTARFSGNQFYRSAAGLSVSSLGLGTYLGGLDERVDQAYTGAVATAVCGGINFLDSAINYRHQRSE